MSDRTVIVEFGKFTLWWQPWWTPGWWFRRFPFESGPDHDRRNGWHFYLPLLRLTRSAK